MDAQGIVTCISIVILLFPLVAPNMVSQTNLSNLEKIIHPNKDALLWANCGAKAIHMVESLKDLQTHGIDDARSDCLRDDDIHFTVSAEDEHIIRPDAVPIRRKLMEEIPNSRALDKDIEPIPFAISKADTGGGGIDNTTIIIVVVSTAIMTFILATLLFCWYTRTYGGVQSDEKPLLNLATGGSQNSSFSFHNSVKDPGNAGDQMLFANSNLQKNDSFVNSSVSLGIPLHPPPGNLTAAGLAPLKPPPGRPDLALKTPPGRNDLSVHCPTVNASSPPNRSPASASPATFSTNSIRAPSSRRPPSARRAPSARRPPSGLSPPPSPSAKPPPPPPPLKKGPTPPPPPPTGGRPPPQPPGAGFRPPRPSSEPGELDGDDSNKAKLKPFFWDKVMASPDQAMVWNQIRAGSFQFNEEMIENLFGYNASSEKNKGNNKKSSSQDPSSNFVQIIDPKKAQNLSILLKALNVTTNEVCDALKEGNELPVELIQTLIKMAPTGEEELKLRLYTGDVSRLGTAERFLKKLVEIPFAFKRLESLLFMCTLQEEKDIIKESFETLEAACESLRKSRLFLKLLEAVLKTGNRMNDGTFRGSAQAFKLDTLLKLSDVKGVDQKTTLLHFVVVEIIRAEGIKAAKTTRETNSFSSFKSDDLLEESADQDSDEYYRTLGLEVVSSLSGELEDVKKAAILDAEGLTGTVSKFGQALTKAREFLNTELKNIQKEKVDDGDDDEDQEEDEFAVILANFVEDSEKDVMWMLEEEKRIMALVKDTADYFHGQSGRDEGLRLFVIVRDFLIILDKVCKEIKTTPLVRPSKTKDDSSSKTTETKDDSSYKKTKTEDDSPHTVRDAKDVSTSTMAQTNDATMTPNTDDSEPKRHETDELRGEIKETDDLQDSKETDDPRHKTYKTAHPRSDTDENEDPRRKIKEIYDLLHKIHEGKSPYEMQETQKTPDDWLGKMWEDDDLGHEILEPDHSLDTIKDNNDSKHKTQETGYSGPETQETDDLGPQEHKPENLQTTTNEDDDLRHEKQETDDSKTHVDDIMGPKTKEPRDLKHKTQEDVDSQTETREGYVLEPENDEKDGNEATSKRPSEPHPPAIRVQKERLIPAIAMRRVDTFSSDSSSDEE